MARSTKPAPKPRPKPKPENKDSVIVSKSTEPEQPKLSRHQRFVKLANLRVRRALRDIERIGNLSSSNYEYSESEVNKLADVLTNALQTTIDRFQPKDKKAKRAAENLFAEEGEEAEEEVPAA